MRPHQADPLLPAGVPGVCLARRLVAGRGGAGRRSGCAAGPWGGWGSSSSGRSPSAEWRRCWSARSSCQLAPGPCLAMALVLAGGSARPGLAGPGATYRGVGALVATWAGVMGLLVAWFLPGAEPFRLSRAGRRAAGRDLDRDRRPPGGDDVPGAGGHLRPGPDRHRRPRPRGAARRGPPARAGPAPAPARRGRADPRRRAVHLRAGGRGPGLQRQQGAAADLAARRHRRRRSTVGWLTRAASNRS